MKECAACKHSDVFTYGDENPMLKCCRYPPQVVFDPNDDVVVHYFPYAIHPCGEWAPVAGKTQRVIGTLRKVKNYATRISASAIGICRHLRRGRSDSQSRDQADSATSDETCK